MKRIILMVCALFVVSSSAYAQFGNLMNSIKSNPLVAQQGGIQNTVSKLQGLASTFSQMPLNSGKLEFIKSALPLLTQAKSMSTDFLASVQKGKAVDPSQTSKMNGLLDQVKSLIAQKWPATPLTAAQVPDAANKTKQVGDLFSGMIKNEGDALKGLAQSALAH